MQNQVEELSLQLRKKIQQVVINLEFSSRLKMARSLNNLSQQELSSLLGISRGHLAKLENGLSNSLSEDLLSRIEDKTSFKREWFFEASPYLSGGFFRSFSSLGVKEREKFEEKASFKLKSIKRILEISDAINYDVDFSFLDPELFSDYETPSGRARRLREYWKLKPNTAIKDLFEIIQDNGIFIFPHNQPKIDGYYLIDDLSKTLPPVIGIWVNEDRSVARNNYSLAHELGHLICRHFCPKRRDFIFKKQEEILGRALSEKEKDKLLEDEANEFGVEFLMPEAYFKNYFKTSMKLGDYLSLKKVFHVSVKALIRRAFTLGRIDERKYTYLNVLMSKKGWNTQEPDDVISNTCPENFFLEKDLFSLFKKELGWTDSDILSFSGIKIKEGNELNQFHDLIFPNTKKKSPFNIKFNAS